MAFMDWLTALGEWSPWAPAFTTSAIVGGISFFVGTAYKARIEKGIQSHFDKEIETLRSQLRADEERAKAAFKQQDAEIEALRSGALSGLTARRTILDKRRLEAAEKIWKSVTSHGPHKIASGFSKVLKMDYVVKKCVHDVEFRKIPESILKISGFGDVKNFPKIESAEEERPFVTPILWALFSAYRSIVSLPTIRLLAAQSGMSTDVLKSDEIFKLAKTALPEQAIFIDQYREESMPHLVDLLEQKILEEIQKSIDASGFGKESVDQAAEILKAASAVAEAQRLARNPIPAAAISG